MQFENPLTFVRAMKGAPVSILVAFMFAGKTLSNLELQQWTGYKDDAITPALKLLCTLGWLIAQSAHGPWCLADGRQLPLMEISGLTGFIPSSSSSSNSKFNIPSYLEEQQEEEISGLTGFILENKKALDEVGIREPKRSSLAKLEHVTPQFINAHIKQCKAEGLEIGTAIYRIQNNWAPAERFMAEPDKSLDGYWGKMIALRNREKDEEE